MAGGLILFLGLWAHASAQEAAQAQSASDQDEMNQLVEMLSDDNVLEQVADKLINKLADRAMEQVDLSGELDDTTLAKEAKGGAPPPPPRRAAPAPAPSQGGGIGALGGGIDFGSIWSNLGGGVTPAADKNTPTRGQRGTTLGSDKPSIFDRIRNGKQGAEPAYYGGLPKVVQPAPMRPPVNMRMRTPFANLEDDDAESESANVIAVLVTSFFAGVALTLGVHRLWKGPSKTSESALQGYEPLHG